MALQGTLDTFALPDVLRLLASTKKTGRLVVRDQRGEGSLWVTAGEMAGSWVNGVTDRSGELVLFDLLRFVDGSFTFEPDAPCANPSAPAEIEPLLVRAEMLFAEWQEIAAVVPSMHAWVTLAAELPSPLLSIDQASWRTIVAIGVGATVEHLAATLELGELDASRRVFDLVNLGLATVEVEASHSEHAYQAPVMELAPLSLPEPEPVLPQRTPFDPFADLPALIDLDAPDPRVDPAPKEDTPAPVDAAAVADEAPKPMFEPTDYEPPAFVGPEPVFAPPPPPAPAAGGSDHFDMAAQLATLSPKAAAAVAAAAGGTEEPAAAEAGHDDDGEVAEGGVDDAATGAEGEEEPINRGLLLKFLSSVKS